MRGFVRTLGLKLKVLFTGFVTVGSKSGYLTPLLAGIGRLLSTSNISNHKNCRGGGVEQLKCVRCNKLFATVRARAAHETGCRFCRWCDRMFRSAANRARHERLCLDRPDADVVAE